MWALGSAVSMPSILDGSRDRGAASDGNTSAFLRFFTTQQMEAQAKVAKAKKAVR